MDRSLEIRSKLTAHYAEHHLAPSIPILRLELNGEPYSAMQKKRGLLTLTRDKDPPSTPEVDYKFHVNVPDDRIAQAWGIVADISMRHGCNVMKVMLAREQDPEQAKKVITFYSRPDISEQEILNTVTEITQALHAASIPHCPLPHCDGRIAQGNIINPYISYRRELSRERENHFIPSDRFRVCYVSYNVRDAGLRFPIHYAAERGDANLLLQMLQAPIPPSPAGTTAHPVRTTDTVNAQDDLGQTPLHLAVMKNQSGCIKVLLRNGARTDIANSKNKLPPECTTNLATLRLLEADADLRLTPEEASVPAFRTEAPQDREVSSEVLTGFANLQTQLLSSPAAAAAAAASSAETPPAHTPTLGVPSLRLPSTAAPAAAVRQQQPPPPDAASVKSPPAPYPLNAALAKHAAEQLQPTQSGSLTPPKLPQPKNNF